MHLGEKLAALHQRFGKLVEVCERKQILWCLPLTLHSGWVSIEDKEDHWAVLWTSDRDTHDPLFHGPAIGIDVRKDTGERHRIAGAGLSGAWRTAVTLWPVRDDGEAEEVFRRVQRLVDLAYSYHIVRPWVAKPDIIPSVRG